MKKIIVILLAALAVSSCAIQNKTVEAYYEPVVLDFSPFVEKGFVFSPHELDGTPAGVISLDYYPKRTIFYKKAFAPDDITASSTQDPMRIVGTINNEVSNRDLLEAIYKEAISLKADGVGELSIKRKITPHPTYVDVYYEISGVAVHLK